MGSGEGSLVKGIKLKCAEGAVPYDGLHGCEFVDEAGDGVFANVEDHFVFGDLIKAYGAMVGTGLELLGNHDIKRQHDLATLTFCRGHDFLCSRDHLMFAE